MATFGKNILDSLTTGMYSDSKVIYREYIQNACDQIDKAIDLGIIKKEDASVDITIDAQERYICIFLPQYIRFSFLFARNFHHMIEFLLSPAAQSEELLGICQSPPY